MKSPSCNGTHKIARSAIQVSQQAFLQSRPGVHHRFPISRRNYGADLTSTSEAVNFSQERETVNPFRHASGVSRGGKRTGRAGGSRFIDSDEAFNGHRGRNRARCSNSRQQFFRDDEQSSTERLVRLISLTGCFRRGNWLDCRPRAKAAEATMSLGRTRAQKRSLISTLSEIARAPYKYTITREITKITKDNDNDETHCLS